MGTQRHRFLRQLYRLHQKLAEPLFINTIKRALRYRVTDCETLERIAFLLLQEGQYSLPNVSVEHEFEERESYREGYFSDEPDLSHYDKLIEDDDG